MGISKIKCEKIKQYSEGENLFFQYWGTFFKDGKKCMLYIPKLSLDLQGIKLEPKQATVYGVPIIYNEKYERAGNLLPIEQSCFALTAAPVENIVYKIIEEE